MTWSSGSGISRRLVIATTSMEPVDVSLSVGVTMRAGRSFRIPLASAIVAQTIRPAMNRCVMPQSSEGFRLVALKPFLGWAKLLSRPLPIDLRCKGLDLLASQHLAHQLQ